MITYQIKLEKFATGIQIHLSNKIDLNLLAARLLNPHL